MIQPTLGRIVWFTPDPKCPMSVDRDGRCAAIVTSVQSDSFVNLTVFDADGQTHAKQRVPLVQEGDAPPATGHFCQWMPYQIHRARELAAAAG